MTTRLQIRWVMGALIAFASMAGCGEILGPPDDKVTVVNATQDTVAFSIRDLEDSNLIDPYPFPRARADFAGRILAPGRSERVPVAEIAGYRRRADLRIFSWRVQRDTLRFPQTLTWTHADQLKAAYRVAIEDRLTIQE